MPLKVFSFWILILSVGAMQFFAVVQKHFDGKHGLQRQVADLQNQLKREEIKTYVANYQIKDFQQTVAVLLPKASKGVPNYQKRTIASLVFEPNLEKVKIDFSDTMFEKGKVAYRETEYEQAAVRFQELIAKYPLSRHTIDAYFLLVESRFQAGEIDECIETIDTMVTLFPEHDLTGFALLRMGQIFSGRDRIEDAEQIYRLTLREFDNSEVREQASRLLKDISL